jgi:hypothetical protein
VTADEALQVLNLTRGANGAAIDEAIAREYRLWSNRTNAPDFEARTNAQRRVNLIGEAEAVLLGDRRTRGSNQPPPTGPPTQPNTPSWQADVPPGGVPGRPVWEGMPPSNRPTHVPPSATFPTGPHGPGGFPGGGFPTTGFPPGNGYPGQAYPPPNASPPSAYPPVDALPPAAQPPLLGGLPPYYYRAFSAIESGSTKAVWNWAAFLLGALWYLYRGMWVKALLLVAVVIFSAGWLAIPAWIYCGAMGSYDLWLLRRFGKQGW